MSSIPLFPGAIYLLHPIFMRLYKVNQPDFVQNFYVFLTTVSLAMLLNIILVYNLKPKFTGYTFLVWSMLKIMLVMGYFIVFVLRPQLQLSHSDIFDIMTLYFLYLIYEVIFGIVLLQKNTPNPSSTV